MNTLDLNERCAVVTGGAAGIGLAVAKRMRASGARVALWDRDDASLRAACQVLGSGASSVSVDVANDVSVDAAARQTFATLGRIDVLVCSAGITGPNTTTWEYPVDDWRACSTSTCTACSIATAPSCRYMQRNDYGRIVNIASVAGKEGNPNASAYSASKAAVIGLTKSLGKELARTGIRVNCVTPAAVRTAIFDQMAQSHIDFMLSKIPVGRFGTVDEIAALVTWLASEDCSFSTGAVFDASGRPRDVLSTRRETAGIMIR